ncbi:MAG: hypothetical protein JST15_09835 [Bacteroidetes bacterium]|nr:hypothetical protein [Bacteroidota bacterium]
MKIKFLLFASFLFFNISPSYLNSQTINTTKVLVLGTPHLNTIEGVSEIHLSHLLDSLAIKEFNVIALEQMPPELLLDIKSRTAQSWQELYSYYSNSINIGKRFQIQFNLSFENANILSDSLSKKANLNQSERILLMQASLCSYDLWTAVLNYSLLTDKSKLDTAIINLLGGYANSTNELNLIGVNLAKQLNINRLNYIDNLQDETILELEFPTFFSDYASSKDEIDKMVSKATIYNEIKQLTSESLKRKDLFLLYKFLNSVRYMTEDYYGQWELWLKTNFKSKADRSRYSLWEMRNLQIAVNIMRLVAEHPEEKILIVIGASHKSFLEKYLMQMPDIELLQF